MANRYGPTLSNAENELYWAALARNKPQSERNLNTAMIAAQLAGGQQVNTKRPYFGSSTAAGSKQGFGMPSSLAWYAAGGSGPAGLSNYATRQLGGYNTTSPAAYAARDPSGLLRAAYQGQYGSSSGSGSGGVAGRVLSGDIAGKRSEQAKREADRNMLLNAISQLGGLAGLGGLGGSSGANINLPGLSIVNTAATGTSGAVPGLTQTDLYKQTEKLATALATGKAEPYGEQYWGGLRTGAEQDINTQIRGLMRQTALSRTPGWQEQIQNLLMQRQGQLGQAGREIDIAKGEAGRTERERGLSAMQSLLGLRQQESALKSQTGLGLVNALAGALGQYPYQADDFSAFYSMLGQENPQLLLQLMSQRGGSTSSRYASMRRT